MPRRFARLRRFVGGRTRHGRGRVPDRRARTAAFVRQPRPARADALPRRTGGLCLPCADIFLVKRNGDGQHLWTRNFGDPKHQTTAGVAGSAAGVVAITGELAGVVDFGDGPHSVEGTCSQAFVAVFAPDMRVSF